MRKKTTLALILMMNFACAMAQKTGTTAHPINLGD